MLAETVVVIVPFAGRQGQASNNLALQLYVFTDLTGLCVGRGRECDQCVRPALFLLHAEYGFIALRNGPGALILDAAIVALVAIALSNGVDSAVEVLVLRRRVLIRNTILQMIIE